MSGASSAHSVAKRLRHLAQIYRLSLHLFHPDSEINFPAFQRAAASDSVMFTFWRDDYNGALTVSELLWRFRYEGPLTVSLAIKTGTTNPGYRVRPTEQLRAYCLEIQGLKAGGYKGYRAPLHNPLRRASAIPVRIVLVHSEYADHQGLNSKSFANRILL